MMRRIISLIITLVFLGATLHAEELLLRNISWTGHHASSTVRALYRDSSGFCWLGADRQLLRFDGSHLVDFPLPSDYEGTFYITSIGEVSGRFMVAGTTVGLWRVPDREGHPVFSRIFPKEIRAVNCINVTDSVTMAIGSSEGLHIYEYPSEKLKSVYFDSQRHSAANNVRAAVREHGVLFTVTGTGIFIVDLRTLKHKRLVADSSMADATSVAYCDGRLFVGSLTSGLRVFDATDGRVLGSVDVGCNVVTSLSKRKNGPLFVGTDGNGVIAIDCSDLSVREHLEKRTPKGGLLTSNQVYAVMACSHGELWVGYYQGAADYSLHLNDNFRVYDIPGVLDTHGLTIRTISLSEKGFMLGTRTGFYYISPDRKTVRHVGVPRLRSDMVLAIHQAGGLYYIGTYGGGCMVYDPLTDTLGELPADGENVLGKGHIFSIASDRNGTLWFGTSEGLIAYRDGKIAGHYTESGSRLPDNNVYEIFFDSTGKGWVGTGRGMAVIDPAGGSLRTDLFPEGFINSRSIRYVYEGTGGRLYFVPEKGPLTVSNLDMTDFQDVDPELFNNAEIRSVIEDNDGQMWVTTNNSIFRWDKDKVSKRFGFADGILNPAFISGNPVKDSDGMIWVGNPDGLLSFNPARIEEPADNSPIAITGITCDDRFSDEMYFRTGKDGHYHIDLDSKPHILKVDFSDFLYSKPETTNYEYSTDGVTWKKSSSEMSFILYNLDWGRNVVMLRNTQNKGNEIKLEINVPYPVWYWVVLVSVSAIVVVVVALVVMRRRRERMAEEEDDVWTPSYEGQDPGAGDENVSKPEAAENQDRKKYSSHRLSETDRQDIRERLDKVIEERKPYLDQNLTIGDLSELIDISSHRLSQYFSQCLNQNFYDFINRYRVEEFKRLVQDEKTRSFTLSALSTKAGFTSRSTFFRYFKKFEGITPAEYIQRLG